jgi:hypothetical protein
MLSSIIVRDDRFTALCDHCGAPIERDHARRWEHAPSLIANQDQAARSRFPSQETLPTASSAR